MRSHKGIHPQYQYDLDDYPQPVIPIPEMALEILFCGDGVSDVSPFDALIHLRGGGELRRKCKKTYTLIKTYKGKKYLSYTDVLHEHNTGISISRGTRGRLNIYRMSVAELINTYGDMV